MFNIEKHYYKKGQYVGYSAQGYARKITGAHGCWTCPPRKEEGDKARTITTATLAEMSVRLSHTI